MTATTESSEKKSSKDNYNLLKLLVEEPNNYEKIMVNAASRGNIDVVKLMLEKGAKDYNWAMRCASEGSHMDIIVLMIEKYGANDFNGAMITAAGNGQINVVRFMLAYGANNYDAAMINAAGSGEIDIVKLMIEKGANDYNSAMTEAVENGHIDVVKFMLEKGACNYNYQMSNASSSGYIDIVKLMLERGATDYNDAMSCAASAGQIDIIKLMLEKGANNYNDAIGYAEKRGYDDIVKLLQEHQKTKQINNTDLKTKLLQRVYDPISKQVIEKIPANEIPLSAWERAMANCVVDRTVCTTLYNSWTANHLDKYCNQLKDDVEKYLISHPFDTAMLSVYDDFHSLSVQRHTINDNYLEKILELQYKKIMNFETSISSKNSYYPLINKTLEKMW